MFSRSILLKKGFVFENSNISLSVIRYAVGMISDESNNIT